MDDARAIVIATGSRPSGPLGRFVAAMWLLAALAGVILIFALSLALALLLIPVVMILLLAAWLRFKLRRPDGRRNVRIRR